MSTKARKPPTKINITAASKTHPIGADDCFIVRLSCCGRADGTYGPCSYSEADKFRESYLGGIGVGSTGHHRSAIIEALTP